MESLHSCEKLSIRESAKSLKKYGSTSTHTSRNQNLIKHIITSSDTLQGIALKYGVTMEQIRRINRLWASDSLFLRESLMIPATDNICSPSDKETVNLENHLEEVISPNSLDEDAYNFLYKIDTSIANSKEEVKKFCGRSLYASNSECDSSDRKKPAVSRRKQLLNNNSFSDLGSAPRTTVVTSQGRKLQTSLQRLEQQQDELFEL